VRERPYRDSLLMVSRASIEVVCIPWRFAELDLWVSSRRNPPLTLGRQREVWRGSQVSREDLCPS